MLGDFNSRRSSARSVTSSSSCTCSTHRRRYSLSSDQRDCRFAIRDDGVRLEQLCLGDGYRLGGSSRED